MCIVQLPIDELASCKASCSAEKPALSVSEKPALSVSPSSSSETSLSSSNQEYDEEPPKPALEATDCDDSCSEVSLKSELSKPTDEQGGYSASSEASSSSRPVETSGSAAKPVRLKLTPRKRRSASAEASSSSRPVETSGSAAKPVRLKPAPRKRRASPSTAREVEVWRNPRFPSASPASPSPAPPAEDLETYPLADALFKAVGQKMDAGEAERRVFAELAEQLWTGSLASTPPVGSTTPNPRVSKRRLECMLTKVKSVRQVYHSRLFHLGHINDEDLKRSLTETECKLVHNAWMNDVSAWMSSDCLQDYNTLIREADALPTGKSGKKGGGKGSAAKPVVGPRQKDQQLKKQRFNKVVNDIAANKAFFSLALSAIPPC